MKFSTLSRAGVRAGSLGAQFADGDRIRFAVPPGHGLKKLPDLLGWEARPKGSMRFAIGVDLSNGRSAFLFPPYDVTVRRGKERFQLWCPTRQSEIAEIKELIRQVHPQSQAPRGMLLGLRSLNEASASKAEILGGATIGEIHYTNFPERDAFASAILGEDWLDQLNSGELSRSEVVRHLGVTCGRRFAIRPDRQGEALGDLLATHAGIVAAAHRWPPADYIEVTRKMPSEAFLRICHNDRDDFLTRSCYVPVRSWRWARNKGNEHEATTTFAPARAVHAYYFKPIARHRGRWPRLQRAIRGAKGSFVRAAGH